jgi:hypothetical protein
MRTLVAGIALITVANAAALLGVAYNRNGEPESRLTLTERELGSPYWPAFERESAGIDLKLNWQVLMRGETPESSRLRPGVQWLDDAKLAALGFDMRWSPDMPDAAQHYSRELARGVYLVLELDGPAYQESVRRMQEQVDEAPAGTPARLSAIEALKREQERASRLFVVDAAPDAAALRAKYPDRRHYAILRGRIALGFLRGYSGVPNHVEGQISQVVNDSISVPSVWLPLFRRIIRTDTSMTWTPHSRRHSRHRSQLEEDSSPGL